MNINMKKIAILTKISDSYNYYHRIEENDKKIIDVSISDSPIDLMLIEALKFNVVVTYLDIQKCTISDETFVALANLLKVNKTITTINLSFNNIDDSKVKNLADNLKGNDTLVDLILSGNKIGDKGAKDLANSLIGNNTLTKLALDNNKMGEEGIKYFVDILKENNTLLYFNIAKNHITDKGAEYILDIIKNNNIINIDLDKNKISDNLFQEIKNILKENNHNNIDKLFKIISKRIRCLEDEKHQESKIFSQKIKEIIKEEQYIIKIKYSVDQIKNHLFLDDIFDYIEKKLAKTQIWNDYTSCVFKKLKLMVNEISEEDFKSQIIIPKSDNDLNSKLDLLKPNKINIVNDNTHQNPKPIDNNFKLDELIQQFGSLSINPSNPIFSEAFDVEISLIGNRKGI